MEDILPVSDLGIIPHLRILHRLGCKVFKPTPEQIVDVWTAITGSIVDNTFTNLTIISKRIIDFRKELVQAGLPPQPPPAVHFNFPARSDPKIDIVLKTQHDLVGAVNHIASDMETIKTNVDGVAQRQREHESRVISRLTAWEQHND